MKTITIAEITSVHPSTDIRINRYVKYFSSFNYKIKKFSAQTNLSKKIISLPNFPFYYFFYIGIRFFLVLRCILFSLAIKTDIMHVHDPELTFPISIICKLRDKKIIIDIHELYTKNFFWQKYFVLSFKLLKSKALFIGAGTDIVNDLKRIGIKSQLIKNFPLKDEYETKYKKSYEKNIYFKTNDDSLKIFFSGGYHEERCLIQFLEALKLIENKLNYQVVICGKGYNDWEKKREIYKNSKINFYGLLDYRDCLEICKKADVSIVLYTKNNKNNHSVRSNRLFESINIGTPVIVSNFGEWLSFISKYSIGLAVDPSSPESISRALLEIFYDRNNNQMYGSLCKNMQGKFSWEKENIHLIEGINKLIKSK